ncbi:N-acetyltransferase [Hyphomicrobium methylovorum]|uniref:GNAT family N-acetyltransferase n=1 Tax=Hyphomicrobium methylovorum TaxID=84 RepID=UPI0015E71A8F|nr:GNAT family N-acetyltransferase [Hyphomicrobium methylovorum]MBA2126183.1 N-acetyltransferase [Hyphomicrobium methylovorum]
MLNQRLDVSVRHALPSDASALARIFSESWRLAYTGILPSQHIEHEILRRDPAWWRRTISTERNLIVLQHGEFVVGYASCGRARGGRRDTGEIYELYLAPVYQGFGLGEHLFETCRATLDDLGFERLVVWALTENEGARNFYLRCGGRPGRSSCIRTGKVITTRISYEW